MEDRHAEAAGLGFSVHLSLGFWSKAESGEFSLTQDREQHVREKGQKEQTPGKLDGWPLAGWQCLG